MDETELPDGKGQAGSREREDRYNGAKPSKRSIQHLVVISAGKEYENEDMYVYVRLKYYAVLQKLTYCN